LRERGLDFVDARLFFDGRNVVSEAAPRGGEARWRSTTIIEGRFVSLIWTWRGERVRGDYDAQGTWQ
jgi:hypothetical protein